MNRLIYILFLSIFLLDFFTYQLGLLPRAVTWITELEMLFVTFIIALRFAVNQQINCHIKYVSFWFLYMVVITVGVILNAVGWSTLMIGARVYFKHFPLFLLPAVYAFSDEEIQAQFKFILYLLLLQAPVSIFQFLFLSRKAGDAIAGTLWVSGILTMTLMCSLAVVFAFYIKKKITLRTFIIIGICLFVPTTLNETKISVMILPIAILLPGLLSGEKMRIINMKTFIRASGLLALLLVIFIPVYNYYYTVVDPRNMNIVDFFLQNKVKHYLYQGWNTKRGLRISDWKPGRDIGRVDSILLGYDYIARDPYTLVFGVGIGNTMDSYFQSARGSYARYSKTLGAENLALTNLLWEVGIAGTATYILLFIIIFQDALFLSKSADFFGHFALGWCAVVVIIGICLIYNNWFHLDVINLLFWYFSGIIASRAYRIRENRYVVCNPPHLISSYNI